MSTETIRSAFEAACIQHAEDSGYEGYARLARDGDGYADSHTQAAWWGWCEALQSPEIRALRKDAARLDWIESQFGADIVCFDNGAWEISSVDIFAEGPDLRATINAAMEQQT